MNIEIEGVLEHVGEQAKQIAILRGVQVAQQKVIEAQEKELAELRKASSEQPTV